MLLSKGTSIIVITLSTQVNFSILVFNSCKFRMVSFSVKLVTGVYAKTKKSLEPYLEFNSLKYFKSLSPSGVTSEDASKLKFLTL